MIKLNGGNFYHVQLDDLFRITDDVMCLKEFKLFMVWATLNHPDVSGWAIVKSGGDALVELTGLEIIAKHVDGISYMIRRRGDVAMSILKLGDIWQCINHNCHIRKITTDSFFTDVLNKYFTSP